MAVGAAPLVRIMVRQAPHPHQELSCVLACALRRSHELIEHHLHVPYDLGLQSSFFQAMYSMSETPIRLTWLQLVLSSRLLLTSTASTPSPPASLCISPRYPRPQATPSQLHSPGSQQPYPRQASRYAFQVEISLCKIRTSSSYQSKHSLPLP